MAVAPDLAEAPKLVDVPHLQAARARAAHARAGRALDAPHVVVLRGGMVLPPVDGICAVGASYDIDDDDAAPRAESDAGNLERLEKILGAGVKIAHRRAQPGGFPLGHA